MGWGAQVHRTLLPRTRHHITRILPISLRPSPSPIPPRRWPPASLSIVCWSRRAVLQPQCGPSSHLRICTKYSIAGLPSIVSILSSMPEPRPIHLPAFLTLPGVTRYEMSTQTQRRRHLRCSCLLQSRQDSLRDALRSTVGASNPLRLITLRRWCLGMCQERRNSSATGRSNSIATCRSTCIFRNTFPTCNIPSCHEAQERLHWVSLLVAMIIITPLRSHNVRSCSTSIITRIFHSSCSSNTTSSTAGESATIHRGTISISRKQSHRVSALHVSCDLLSLL